jgi:hypothetical protein
MKIKDLISELNKFDQEDEVMILDGYNGGGNPREINFGPKQISIKEDFIENCADCEEFDVNSKVVILGFGCY